MRIECLCGTNPHRFYLWMPFLSQSVTSQKTAAKETMLTLDFTHLVGIVQAPVVRKPISANPRLNRSNPRNKFILPLNSVSPSLGGALRDIPKNGCEGD